MRVGLVGCGDIAAEYVETIRSFSDLAIHGVAARRAESTERFAARHGLEAVTTEALLADGAVDLVLNLTPPRAHAGVTEAALHAGKHVYSEKPLGVDLAEATRLVNLADAEGLSLCSAPDTFLGGAHQECRALIDEGAIGRLVGGTAAFLGGGHETWHPAPAFFYDLGGGPAKDIGPYYLSTLVNLLGPVEEVTAAQSPAVSERRWTDAEGRARSLPVRVPTHVAGLLRFGGGVLVDLTLSFDVPSRRLRRFELWGTEGAIAIPDPIFFGGAIELKPPGEDWRTIQPRAPFAAPRHRGLGLAEMVCALQAGRTPLTAAPLALHLTEVMDALERPGVHSIRSRAERPTRFAPD